MQGADTFFLAISKALNHPAPTSVVLLGYVVPYLITYLVHLPRTRWIRISLYPIGLFVMAWQLIAPPGNKVNAIRTMQWVIEANLGASTRYAFAHSPPTCYPLQRRPPLARLRDFVMFKSLHLQLNEFRHINMSPNPPMSATRTRSYFHSLGYHLAMVYLHLFFLDLSTYPAYRLAPTTFGASNVGGDFGRWCSDLSKTTGIPRPLVWLFWTLNLAFTTYQGFVLGWHIVAVMSVASGLYADEELPKVAHKPWLSTSLNELWGRRYQQTLQSLFLLLASPLSSFRILHILAVFFVSALYHTVLYQPLHNNFPFRPYMLFYMSNAVGCIFERAYRRLTGKRVGGILGAVWVWLFCIVTSIPMVDYEFSAGFPALMRADLAEDRRLSTVEWLVWWAGMGPRPVRPSRDR